jgi:diketogulonate reductase-like aldo/keto reductase
MMATCAAIDTTLAAVAIPTAKLRGTGVALPLIGLGCSSMTKGQHVLSGLRLGYRHLDTGRATTWGYDESEVGESIALSGVKREELFVQTKIHPEVSSSSLPVSITVLALLQVDDMLWCHAVGELTVFSPRQDLGKTATRRAFAKGPPATSVELR